VVRWQSTWAHAGTQRQGHIQPYADMHSAAVRAGGPGTGGEEVTLGHSGAD
jgi:hypothetical protein